MQRMQSPYYNQRKSKMENFVEVPAEPCGSCGPVLFWVGQKMN